MSLSKLNDQLKADICSFLEFKDINKLAQVNRGIKASLQRRGLDKPKVHCLFFEKQEEQLCSDKLDCFVQLLSDDDDDDMSHKVAEIELDEGFVTNSTEALNWINKFNAIEYLDLRCIRLQDDAGWEDIVAKIRSLVLKESEIKMSKESVMKFFKKFEEVRILDGCDMGPASITDEFFVELVRNGTTVHFTGDMKQVVAVTDVTLDALSSRRIPDKLFLRGLTTGITFERVKKMIEDALKTRKSAFYDFGYLKSDQYNAAHTFMSEEFERWAEGIDPSLEYEGCERGNCGRYIIYSEELSIDIQFAVYREELQQNDNLGEV